MHVHPGPADPRHDVHRAWISLAGLVVSFPLADLLAGALLRAQGADAATASATQAWLAGAPALLVLIAPAIAALVFGVRAHRYDPRAAVAPIVAAVVLVAVLLLLNTGASVVG